MYHLSLLFITVLAFSIERQSHVAGSQLPRVLGVPPSKNSLYAPDKDFECLDGSRIVRFERVNDDYCDCGDGSDEPGTAACANGKFFCQNKGHRPKYFPSSRVNDGICDCCDGSDEYNTSAACLDNCHELGREERQEEEKNAQLAREGNKIRVEMAGQGKRLRSENKAKLAKLQVDYEEAVLTSKEKQNLKTLAEERESVAMEKYKPAEPEQPKGPNVEAKEYFIMLDSDQSGTVTVAELQTRVTFDKDGNGEVTEEEALFFLGNKPEVKFEEFVGLAWIIMKPFVMKEQGTFKPPRYEEPEKELPEEPEEPSDYPTEGDIETEEEVEAPHDDDEPEEPEKEAESAPIEYDEETQALRDEANQARERFHEAEKAVNELRNEIKKLEEKNKRDYGAEDEFSTLDGECYEVRDLEYVYTLCPFGKATQRSVSGGSEVNLGNFNDWIGGPELKKYTKMKYDGGLPCWNGPARNTVVNLRCGTENRLISSSEPSRCEYSMEFTTPALCNPEIDTRDTHDEL